MSKYKNMFEILDAIEESKLAIEEGARFREELAMLGEPENPQLKEIWRSAVKMIHFNMKSNAAMIEQLEIMHQEWKDENNA